MAAPALGRIDDGKLARFIPLWESVDMAAVVTDRLVLCYHAVSERLPAALSVTPEALEWQLNWLRRHGYESSTFTEIERNGRGRRVAISFDDAYRSVLEYAEPLLREYGYAGTLFVPTDYVGQKTPMRWPGIDQWYGTEYEDEFLALGWDGISELAGRGWEIGSHTCSHPRLTELRDAELEDELVRSKAECERHLGVACETIAYPFGDHDLRVADFTRRAGYGAGAALASPVTSPFRYPRVGVYHLDHHRRFETKVSKSARLAMRVRAGLARQRERERRPASSAAIETTRLA